MRYILVVDGYEQHEQFSFADARFEAEQHRIPFNAYDPRTPYNVWVRAASKGDK